MAKVMLLGTEMSDNLSLRYLAAPLIKANHSVKIVDFSSWDKKKNVVRLIKDFQPDLVGLSMVFNARGKEFCQLADFLRRKGFKGHITAGGFFAHFNAHKILQDFTSIDTVVYGEGERTLIDLVENLDSPQTVPGLAVRFKDRTVDSQQRQAILDLDELPFPKHNPRDYLGISEVNILSSRGCWANCHFCSIHAMLKHASIPRMRYRSIRNITDEIELLYKDSGVRIFYFMDDNFLTRDSVKNQRRIDALGMEFQRRGLSNIAITVKCRPDCVKEDTFKRLMEIGLIRVFIGIESFSQMALKMLGRNVDVEENRRALEILSSLDVHTTFNILMFNPDTEHSEIADDIRHLRDFTHIPMNFCRTEVYPGTELERYLRESGRLLGDYFRYDYQIADPQIEALFRTVATAFDGRNFGAYSVHELAMQVDYGIRILRRFYCGSSLEDLGRRTTQFIREVNNDSLDQLQEILDVFDGRERLTDRTRRRFTKNLMRSVHRANDVLWDRGMELWDDMVAATKTGQGSNEFEQPVPTAR